MALVLPSRNPLSYALCADTVTVYHREKDVSGNVTGYHTAVYRKAFFDNKKNLTVEKTGAKDGNSFLLVIPGDKQSVFPGDKVLRGIGPNISTAEQWAQAIPEQVRDLCVVSYVEVKYWNGRIIHTEAGG